ncbi:hypothetical protein SLA2020_361310 [Shorea laevis]
MLGLSVTNVRKIMQTIGFLGPAFFLTQLSHVDSTAKAVFCMACSQGTDAFSESGLIQTIKILSLGILKYCLGYPTRQQCSWDDVFKVSVGLYLVGTVVWNLFSTGEKILD